MRPNGPSNTAGQQWCRLEGVLLLRLDISDHEQNRAKFCYVNKLALSKYTPQIQSVPKCPKPISPLLWRHFRRLGLQLTRGQLRFAHKPDARNWTNSAISCEVSLGAQQQDTQEGKAARKKDRVLKQQFLCYSIMLFGPQRPLPFQRHFRLIVRY
jgi:hypothetical protein